MSNMSPYCDTANVPHDRSTGTQIKHSLSKVHSNPELFQERRRTLHTVHEISEITAASAHGVSNPKSNPVNGNVATRGARSSRRRSLPIQGGVLEMGSRTKPSITITPADPPPLRRSITDPMDWMQGACVRSNKGTQGGADLNGFSLDSHVRKRYSQGPQLGPVPERKHPGSHSARHSPGMPMYASDRTASKGEQPVQIQGAVSVLPPHGIGWNATRERELTRREQAVVEAKARREKEGRRLATGSSSKLPSLSPFPMVKPKEAYTRDNTDQQQLLQNSRTMNRTPRSINCRTSQLRMEIEMNNGDSSQLPGRASTISNPHSTSYQASTNRPLSTVFNPPYTVQTEVGPIPIRSPPPRSFSSPIPQEQYPPIQSHSSSSLQPSPTSITRASSTHSVASTATRYSQMTNASRTSLNSRSRRHTQSGTTQQHLDALASLTGTQLRQKPGKNEHMTAESFAFFEAQQKHDRKLRRVSRASASQVSLAKSISRSPSHPLNPSNLSSTSRRQSQRDAQSNGSTIIYDENPDKRNLASPDATSESIRLQREREKLLRWKAEREKSEFERRERAKIRERVRRANELEEEKEKELLKDAKKKKKEKGWFCGLFGI